MPEGVVVCLYGQEERGVATVHEMPKKSPEDGRRMPGVEVLLNCVW